MRQIRENNLKMWGLWQFWVMAARLGEWILAEEGLKRLSPHFTQALEQKYKDQQSEI